MAKQINCGICAIHGETTAMNLVNSFFRCPECGAELHVNDTGDNTFIKSWQQQQQYRSCSLPEGVKVHGGGDSTGKSKKEAMKKPSVSKLSFNLYK
ncbi:MULTISPECIES: hypothetical protein [Pelosinus]|uniref:Uncharacterized protein n=1 Tax=Pelosinus fermentans B4 TaxID=1149862 RepID=I8RNP5_9FIRM|nr:MULTISPECIES: hypothetical protein [Pelosinus]EIW20730.1 hypothetical protein FB4_1942 [Pelosinus fermentans B4]EIW25425.1 hypothetical protein FA11_2584 [Pelosinus fermentans A11]OAM93683.1 hypothetical protein FR7_01700 [Pelosinus fermentans DSM 17108]SDQ86463.1 hypothetical protein SAMN04515679_1786 [Pelosinus fermentans]